MLEQLILHNFQPHRRTTLGFDPLVTSLTGPTGSGKSSILRALRWGFLNQGPTDPSHWDADFARAVFTVDGHTVIRSKGKRNLYKLDGKVFKSFGSTVPRPIAELLNVGDVNFQSQLDAHFWLMETPGQLSRALNEIINLGVIDRVLGSLSGELRKARTLFEDKKEASKQAKESLAELSFVPKLVQEYEALESRHRVIAFEKGHIASFAKILGQAKGAQVRPRIMAQALKQGRKLAATARTLRTDRARLERLRSQLDQCRRAELKRKVKGPPPHVLGEFLDSLEHGRERVKLLRYIVEELKRWQALKEERRTRVTRLAEGSCPTCGQSLPSRPTPSPS